MCGKIKILVAKSQNFVTRVKWAAKILKHAGKILSLEGVPAKDCRTAAIERSSYKFVALRNSNS